MMNPFYYFRMLRIKDWIKLYFWVPLVGAILVFPSLKSFFLVAVIYFCATSYSFVVNNYFDVEIDKKHKEKVKSNTNPLAQGFITKKGTLFLLGVLLLVSLVLAIRMNFVGFIFVALSLLVSTLYSMRRIRLKEKPVIDIITHGLMFGFFPFLAGVTLTGGSINLFFILIGILFALWAANLLLVHQMVDYEQDIGNTTTTVIKFGRKVGYICLILFFFAYLLCSIVILNYFVTKWWFCYLLMFSILWFPLNYLKDNKNENIYQWLKK